MEHIGSKILRVTCSLCSTGTQMLSSYLRATLGHSYLTACKGKGPSKWWNKGKNCGFIEKGELALKCCAIVPPVTTKNFNTEDMIFFSAPAYIYSNDMH